MNKIVVGSKVRWLCKPFSRPEFECEGYVEGLKQSVFGSKVRGMGAMILVSSPEYQKEYKGKNHAFIAVKNLTLV